MTRRSLLTRARSQALRHDVPLYDLAAQVAALGADSLLPDWSPTSADEMPDTLSCRGCGEEISGAWGELCSACAREQDEESAADQRADR